MPHKTICLAVRDLLNILGTDFDFLVTVNLRKKSSSVLLPLLKDTKEGTMITVKFGYDAAPDVKVVVVCKALDKINNSECCHIIEFPGDYLQLMKIEGTWVRLK